MEILLYLIHDLRPGSRKGERTVRLLISEQLAEEHGLADVAYASPECVSRPYIAARSRRCRVLDVLTLLLSGREIDVRDAAGRGLPLLSERCSRRLPDACER